MEKCNDKWEESLTSISYFKGVIIITTKFDLLGMGVQELMDKYCPFFIFKCLVFYAFSKYYNALFLMFFIEFFVFYFCWSSTSIYFWYKYYYVPIWEKNGYHLREFLSPGWTNIWLDRLQMSWNDIHSKLPRN